MVTRHRADVAWGGRGAVDVAGPAAPRIMARQWRATDPSATVPRRVAWRGWTKHTARAPTPAATPAAGPGYLDGRIETRRASILLSFFTAE